MHFRPFSRLSPPPAAPVCGVVRQRRPRANAGGGARLASRAVAALAGTALAGCGGNPFAPNTAYNLDTQETVFQVYPLSTATGALRSAVNVMTLTAVRPALATVPVGQTVVIAPNFDFAVDRSADGRVRLLPSKLVAGLGAAGLSLQTGFQTVTTAFNALDEAPGSGYQTDSVTTVGVGQTVVVQVQALSCYGSARPNVYAKLVVDSVAAGSGPVYLRARVDPNCGFRSLKVGKPTT